jgi:hypothetical protein
MKQVIIVRNLVFLIILFFATRTDLMNLPHINR